LPRRIPGEFFCRKSLGGSAFQEIVSEYTNINSTEDSQDKFLYFARYRSREARK
jgi:hypothetical protein